MPPDDGERELVAAAASGDENAAREIVRRESPRLWRAAIAILGRHDAAEDALQDAFERAFSRLSRFDPERPLGPWLHRIVINCCMDRLRRESRRPEAPLLIEVTSGVDEGHRVQEIADTRMALAHLPPERRVVVVLRHYLGYTPAEIASILDVPEGTVFSRLSRGLQELKQRLTEPSGE